jgi:hypothetical protein
MQGHVRIIFGDAVQVIENCDPIVLIYLLIVLLSRS